MTDLTSETTEINILEYTGDTISVSLLYTDELNVPINLSGFSFTFTVKTPDLSSTLLTLTSPVGIILNQSADINIYFELSGQQTEILGKGSFPIALISTDVAGFVNTLIVGKLKLKPR